MNTQADLSNDLRQLARKLRIYKIGFAPINAFDDAPEGRRPTDFLPNACSIISIGYRLNYGPIQNLPESRSAYMLEHDYANRHLAEASQIIARFLEERGFQAVGFDAGAGFYTRLADSPQRLAGDFSHKHAAYACGMGTFGVNNLILTREYGPRIRFTSILTNAELEYSTIETKNLCLSPSCDACVRACPVDALDAWESKYSPVEGWRMEKRKCYDYMFGTLGGKRCGLCIKACPVGLEATRSDS